MFSIPKSKQTTFIYSPEVYKNLIPEDTILYRINQKIDFSFVNEACKDLYSPDKGRPVENTPERMFRFTIVQYLNDFSKQRYGTFRQIRHYNKMVYWNPNRGEILRSPCTGRF